MVLVLRKLRLRGRVGGVPVSQPYPRIGERLKEGVCNEQIPFESFRCEENP